jgi:creatinine amidohydrolase
MMPSDQEIESVLARSVTRLHELGVRVAVLFIGHFTTEQVAVVERVTDDWNARGYSMRALGLSLGSASGLTIAPDHAGRFETTLVHAHLPARVALDEIPPPRAEEAAEDPWGAARHTPGNSLWGVVGPDPRDFDPAEGPPLLDGCVRWLLAELDRVESDPRASAG